MWISRKRVEEDLQERLGEDYPKVRWYVRIELYAMLTVFSFVMLSVLPYTRLYFWWILDPHYFLIYLLLIPAIMLTRQIVMGKYDRDDKLSGSLYRKREVRIILPIFLAFCAIYVFFVHLLPDQSIPLEAMKLGREVQVPTYVPFQVEDEGGMSSRQGTLSLDYSDHDFDPSYVGPSDSLVVEVSPHLTDQAKGHAITLRDGTMATFEQSCTPCESYDTRYDWELVWQRDGLWYSLTLDSSSNKFSQQDVIDIANSFQPVESAEMDLLNPVRWFDNYGGR